MKKYSIARYCALFLTLFISSNVLLAQKAEVVPVTKLQKITVFTDRAMISKEATFTVRKGENLIRIPGITPFLVDQSVQVNLMGQPDLAISEIAIEETFLKKTDQPEMQRLQNELNKLIAQIDEENSQYHVINSSSDFLKKVIPFPQNQKVTTAEIEAHARFLEKSLAANFERMSVIQDKLKKMNEQKSDLENQLASLKSDKNKSKNIVIHLLSATEKTGVKFGFSYLTTQAGWTSQYEARADFNTAKVDLNYLASIWQSTGEDWIDANIEISTAKPFVYGNLPELNAWYLDVYAPRLYKTKSAVAMEAVNAPRIMFDRGTASAAENEISFKETEVNEENTSFSFVLPRKVDIISDGQPHRVSISKSIAEAKYTWFTIPKLVQNAILKASMKNPFSFPLLAGQISVFFDQKLVGTAFINQTILADGDLELSLGIDEGIKIERKLLKKYTDYAGLLSKETTVYFEYQIEITNGKSKEVTLDMNDQFPVSRNEKIKVEMQTPKGSDATINEEGKISWKLTLAPGAKKSVPVKFSVSYPKELTITGI